MNKQTLKIAGFSLLLLLLIAGAGAFSLISSFTQTGSHLGERIVLIEGGSSLAGIANTLEDEDAISSAFVFRVMVRLMGNSAKMQAGEYRIPAGASMAEVYALLLSGQVVQHRLTVAEGLSSQEVMAVLLANPVLLKDDDSIPDEGTLLPETYQFTRGATVSELVTRMQRGQDAVLSELWARYGGAVSPLDSLEEVVILASIVEKETAIAEERPMIAAVFLNRLKKGMRLQSDPTVIYAVTGGLPLGRPLRQSDLDRDDPYNTYRVRGLPPGPIANPGQAALEAVFNPAETDALYFVADGSGGHVFAETLEQHNRNVARWREVERVRNMQESANDD